MNKLINVLLFPICFPIAMTSKAYRKWIVETFKKEFKKSGVKFRW